MTLRSPEQQNAFLPEEHWKSSFDTPNNFDPEKYVFAVSGFRNSNLFENPRALIDPYFGHLYASIIGRGTSITPNKNGKPWRLKAFRPWGAVLSFEPRAIMELRDHDPGPLDVEYKTASIQWETTTPLAILSTTLLYNEMLLRLDRREELVRIIGYFSFRDQLESAEAQLLFNRSKSESLPFIVLDNSDGSAATIPSS